MLPSPVLYFSLLALCAVALAAVSFRADRILGWAVLFALSVNVIGAGLMGWWVERVHGRPYTSADEVGYQWEGAQLLTSWRTGDTSYVRATVGIYAPINAGVMAIAGPGQTPMRLTTALVGGIGVPAAFWLAMLLYRSVSTARVAACLCATSPLLILFAWANLRDRWIGTGALLVLVAALLTIQRPTWRRVLALMAAVWFLAELRHYWATLLGNLAIAGSLLFGAAGWPRRIANTGIVTLAVGFALWIVTATFLGLGIRNETARRYVTLPNVTSPPAAAYAGPPPAAGSGASGSTAAAPAARTLPSGRSSARPGAATASSPGASTSHASAPTASSPTASSPTASAPTASAPTVAASARPATPSAATPSSATPSAAIPYSGPTLGESQAATRPDNLRALLGNLSFVLFGRLQARADGGQYASIFLWPEALWSFLLIPLAAIGVLISVWRGDVAVLIPAAYVGAIMAVLTWLHGDDWTTYRFRNLYWPVLLVLVAGGMSATYDWWRLQRQAASGEDHRGLDA